MFYILSYSVALILVVYLLIPLFSSSLCFPNKFTLFKIKKNHQSLLNNISAHIFWTRQPLVAIPYIHCDPSLSLLGSLLCSPPLPHLCLIRIVQSNWAKLSISHLPTVPATTSIWTTGDPGSFSHFHLGFWSMMLILIRNH